MFFPARDLEMHIELLFPFINLPSSSRFVCRAGSGIRRQKPFALLDLRTCRRGSACCLASASGTRPGKAGVTGQAGLRAERALCCGPRLEGWARVEARPGETASRAPQRGAHGLWKMPGWLHVGAERLEGRLYFPPLIRHQHTSHV